MRLFLVPGELVSGGISGIAQIVNHYVNFPIGVMVLVGNIPLFILGWRFLGGRRFAARTAVSVAAFSFFTDLLVFFIPAAGMTHDNFLNAIYGAVLLGIGLGLVYRGSGTSGGSEKLGRILNHRFGISISMAYMITDTLVVLAGGFAFSWEKALYRLMVIYVSGLAAEAVAEGSGIFRTAIIITTKPDEVIHEIMYTMERGVTILTGIGRTLGLGALGGTVSSLAAGLLRVLLQYAAVSLRASSSSASVSRPSSPASRSRTFSPPAAASVYQ